MGGGSEKAIAIAIAVGFYFAISFKTRQICLIVTN